MRRGSILVAWLVAATACNTAFGIDDTKLASDNPRTLVLDTTSIRTDLVDFPLLVVLDDTRIDYDRVPHPQTDLRFYAPDDDLDLPFEIESWDPSGRSIVWVRVPLLRAGATSQQLRMYFGTDAGGTERKTDVWEGYDVVLHGTPGAAASVTSNGYTGEATGIANAPGKIGSAFSLVDDGGPHTIELPGTLFDGWSSYTLEMWVYLDYPSTAGYRSPGPEPALVDKRADASLSSPLRGGRFYNDGVDFLFSAQLDTQYTVDDTQYAHTFVRVQRWSHMLWTFDGQVQWLYRDGDFFDVTKLSAPGSLIAGSGPLVIGSSGDPINGLVDEIRVTHGYRDPDWVFAQYLSMTDRLVTFRLPGELL